MDTKTFSNPISPKDIKITDPFWARYMELARTEVIPYQWEALNDRLPDTEPSYWVKNFRVAAGLEEDGFNGRVFQDSDGFKWLEAVAYSLMSHPDPELEKTADEVIDLICAAQQPDGYLDTYYIINGLDKRWTNLRDNHEMYCLGHMTESAVAYYEATGKDKFLNAVIRYVDLVDANFGPEPGKMKGYPGHEILEMALVRLYNVTKNEKHLKLAKYFIDQRGQAPLYFEEEGKKYNKPSYWAENKWLNNRYYQADVPVREQEFAEGHAVRAVYLYSGMASVARETGDVTLLKACDRIWKDIVERQMYITGGIGSCDVGESFSYDYDLPNDTAYNETCAAIGLMFFARRMLEIRADSSYSDAMERALYNGVISGMSQDGKRFFYVNPLEVDPEACEKSSIHFHVEPVRQKWFACACCPPNLARLLTSLGSYAYTLNDDSVYMHLFVGGDFAHTVGGKSVSFSVNTKYPWEGNIAVKMAMEGEASFTYALRIPGWCNGKYTLKVNGEAAACEMKDGYALLNRTWKNGDEITLELPMDVRVMTANLKVREDVNKVAVTCGPIVYCLEEADNGKNLHLVHLGKKRDFKVAFDPNFFGGMNVITVTGEAQKQDDCTTLYREDSEPVFEEKTLKLIPYYAWANRGVNEMTVWMYR